MPPAASTRRTNWPAALLCCLLVASALVEEDALASLFEPTPPAGRVVSEEDAPTDEDHLYRVRGLHDSARHERRDAGPLLFTLGLCASDPRLSPFAARSAHSGRSGRCREHDHRNGHGGPLLC